MFIVSCSYSAYLPIHVRRCRLVRPEIVSPFSARSPLLQTMATETEEKAKSLTSLVYQWDERLRDLSTRVTSIHQYVDISSEEQALFKSGTEKTYALETKETIFYVQGGGQPFDNGSIRPVEGAGKDKKFNVEAVRYGSQGKVLHFGHFENDETFEEGEMVEQSIDSARRDNNSRVHTAGHLIGLSVRKLVGSNSDLNATELKASHYPDAAFVEFKGVIDGKFKDAIQQQATQYVSEALPVKLYAYKPEELDENGVITAEGMPIVAGADGKVRVVDIVGAGAYPCGGTHVPDSSYVGEVIVRNIKRQKGISKVSYTVKDKDS